jgi:hypothetical protein
MPKLFLAWYFVAFVAFTGFAVSQDGLLSPFPPFERWHTYQIFFDLGTSIGLVSIWVYYDMQKRGRPAAYFIAYLVGVGVSGSIAPMLYLLLFRPEPSDDSEAPHRPRVAQ